MKSKLKRLCDQVSFDRIVILLLVVVLVIAFASAGQVRKVSIWALFALPIILLIRFCIYSFRSVPKSNPDCYRGKIAMSIMTKLANEMNVRLHPTKSLEIKPQLRGASASSWFFSSGGSVSIGCTLLCGLDDMALKGIIAHELAHLKKRHSLKTLPCLLLFIPVIVFGIASKSTTIIPILVSLGLGTIVFSMLSWHYEYQADVVAAEYVGKKEMAHALEQVSSLLYRPGDTLAHPSFKKRISHVLSEEKRIP